MKDFEARRVEVLATTGPALTNAGDFIEAIRAGAQNFRLNLGKKDRDHCSHFINIRSASEKINANANVFIDLPSNRPRVNEIRDTYIKKGDLVVLGEAQSSNGHFIYIPVDGISKFINHVNPKDRVLFRDGKLQFLVREVSILNEEILIECVNAKAALESNSAISFPESGMIYQSLTSQDYELLLRMKKNGLVPDWICISFVNHPNDIKNVNRELKQLFPQSIKLMAKIESKEGLENITDILNISDGVMVARGDLALNIEPEKVPKTQEMIVNYARKADKFVVVATQMLEGFARTGIPVRSELSDIALAIRQGTNCIMLSGESGGSKRSQDCIKLMNKIIQEELTSNRTNLKGEIRLNRNDSKTEIMATAGPTMEEVEQIQRAIQAGAASFRLNIGLRTRDMLQYFRNIRLASEKVGCSVKVLLDLPTSRPRIGKMKPMELSEGEFVTLVNQKKIPNSKDRTIPLYGISDIIPVLEEGHRILFRDGKVVFSVKEIVDNQTVRLQCMKVSTILRPLGSCAFPDSDVNYHPIVSEDLRLFDKFIADQLVPDYVSLSFASHAQQMKEIRDVLRSYWGNKDIKVIAKIETQNGINNFVEILEEADGIMVARGDLLLHVPPQTLPKIQKYLVEKTNTINKVSIVATEMFEQFAVNGVVNRAELSDVALAIRQQANAVMLSRETGNSHFPIETIEMIQKLIEEEHNSDFNF